MILMLLATFVLVTAPDGSQHVRSYEGQSQATIQSLILNEGKTSVFITPQEYNDFVEAHKPPVLTPEQIVLVQRTEAIRLISTDPTSPAKALRAILLLLLDEINLLRQRDVDRSTDVAAATSLADLKTRWAARAALNDRTIPQAKAAVQNKIGSGDAD